MYEIKVKMKRGGFIPMLAEANITNDSDGAGQKWTEVEITSLQWMHGAKGKRYKVNEKNIADMDQVRDAILEAAESSRESAMIDAAERALDR